MHPEEPFMITYTGLCVIRLPLGEIDHVRVQDTTGNGTWLEPEEYRRRAVPPPLDQLPDCTNEDVPSGAGT